MQPDDTPIARVLRWYFPDWEPPEDRGGWNKTLCPFHREENPSATVNYEKNAFNCFGCGAKGDVISIIRQKEEVSFAQANRHAQEVLGAGYEPVSKKPSRKRSRRVFE